MTQKIPLLANEFLSDLFFFKATRKSFDFFFFFERKIIIIMGIYEVSLPSSNDLDLREKEKEKKGDHGFPVEARSPKNLTKTGIVIYLTIHLLNPFKIAGKKDENFTRISMADWFHHQPAITTHGQK